MAPSDFDIFGTNYYGRSIADMHRSALDSQVRYMRDAARRQADLMGVSARYYEPESKPKPKTFIQELRAETSEWLRDAFN